MLESLINQDFWVTLAGAAAVLLQFVLTASVILRVILTRHPPGNEFGRFLQASRFRTASRNGPIGSAHAGNRNRLRTLGIPHAKGTVLR